MGEKNGRQKKIQLMMGAAIGPSDSCLSQPPGTASSGILMTPAQSISGRRAVRAKLRPKWVPSIVPPIIHQAAN